MLGNFDSFCSHIFQMSWMLFITHLDGCTTIFCVTILQWIFYKNKRTMEVLQPWDIYRHESEYSNINNSIYPSSTKLADYRSDFQLRWIQYKDPGPAYHSLEGSLSAQLEDLYNFSFNISDTFTLTNLVITFMIPLHLSMKLVIKNLYNILDFWNYEHHHTQLLKQFPKTVIIMM